MDRKILELCSRCLFFAHQSDGRSDSPYVELRISTLGDGVEVVIMNNGFRCCERYDGWYKFNLEKFDEETYEQCKEHLARLRDKVVKM